MKKTMKTIYVAAFLFMGLVPTAFSAGIVAETKSSKLIIFEWDTHGTGIPPVFVSATLKIIDVEGNILYQEAFTKNDVVEYDEKALKEGKYKVRLLIQGAKGRFDLRFSGTERETDTAEEGKEIDVLARILKQRGRPIEPGSSLTVDTSIGRFTVRDIICGIYGDI